MKDAFAHVPPMVSRKCLIAADDGSMRISWEDIRGIDGYLAQLTARLEAATELLREVSARPLGSLSKRAQAFLDGKPDERSET